MTSFSVEVFSTAAPIVDTEISKQILEIKRIRNLLKIPSREMLAIYKARGSSWNSGPPSTNPSKYGREQDLKPGTLDYKSSALTTRLRRLLIVCRTT